MKIFQKKIDNKRDIYLDICRGGAAISIIWIHTLYQSGGGYVPKDTPLRTIGLLFDVPFFMFLSGWSVFYHLDFRRTVHNLIKTWLFWIAVISIIDFGYYAIMQHSGGVEYKQYIWQILFQNTSEFIPSYTTIIASLWYMPVYLTVVSLGTLILCFARRENWARIDYICLMLLCIVAVIYITAGIGETFLLLSAYSWFYLLFFVMGYYSQRFRVGIRNARMLLLRILLIGISYAGISKLFGLDFRDLQASKFPPNILYLCASMLTICIAIYLRDRISVKNKGITKAISFIGQNSLCFYFSQGIGGTLLYVVSGKIICDWHLKVVICFLINFMVSMIFGLFFVFLQQVLFDVIRIVQERGRKWGA